mmetsp:Transcript_87394/g.182885  ORF Transcript_87394/g.182885 Transcript_87394/m.182885 type:complete len:237 (+) Transcript_87394:24-734(+)
MGRKRHALGPPDSEASYEAVGDPLLMALFEGDDEGARRILEKGESNIEAADQLGWRPLHRASFGGLSGVLASLLERRADASAVDNDGLQPLHVAASAGHEECCRLLIAAGADPTAPDGYSGMSAQMYTLVQEPHVAQQLQQVLGSPDLDAWACPGDHSGGARQTASKGPEAHWATDMAIQEGDDEEVDDEEEGEPDTEGLRKPGGAQDVPEDAPEAASDQKVSDKIAAPTKEKEGA